MPLALNESGVKSALVRSVAASWTRPPRSVKSKSAVSLTASPSRRWRFGGTGPAPRRWSFGGTSVRRHLVAFVADRLLDVVKPQGAAFDRRRGWLTEGQQRAERRERQGDTHGAHSGTATGLSLANRYRRDRHESTTDTRKAEVVVISCFRGRPGRSAYDRRVPYPVAIDVQPAHTNRNRLTVAFRIILAIPHLLLIGGIGMGFALQSGRPGTGTSTSFGSETGLLGAVAYVLAIVTWFAIVIGGRDIPAIRQYTVFYLRWRVRALSYLMLLGDAYPPFGDDPYPASLAFVESEGPRRRLSVGFRLILIIPQLIVDRIAQLSRGGSRRSWRGWRFCSPAITEGALRVQCRRPALVHSCRSLSAPARGRIPTILIRVI